MKPMEDNKKIQTILAFVADLFFSSRIEQVARRMGYEIHWIEKAEDLFPGRFSSSIRQYAEHLEGPGAVLMQKLTNMQPVLLIFDLNNSDIPWQSWIALIKSAPATRRLPVICFGSHVDVEVFKIAKDVGADTVVARSRFVNDMPKLIEKYARKMDFGALQDSCALPLSGMAIKGLEEFNRGEYFQAHESLEEAWNEDTSPGRELYRAILQIAVAYLQIGRGNYRGAVKMFLRVRQWIDPLPDWCRGVNVARLRADSIRVYQMLLELGSERLPEFDYSLMKPLEYKA